MQCSDLKEITNHLEQYKRAMGQHKKPIVLKGCIPLIGYIKKKATMINVDNNERSFIRERTEVLHQVRKRMRLQAANARLSEITPAPRQKDRLENGRLPETAPKRQKQLEKLRQKSPALGEQQSINDEEKTAPQPQNQFEDLRRKSPVPGEQQSINDEERVVEVHQQEVHENAEVDLINEEAAELHHGEDLTCDADMTESIIDEMMLGEEAATLEQQQFDERQYDEAPVLNEDCTEQLGVVAPLRDVEDVIFAEGRAVEHDNGLQSYATLASFFQTLSDVVAGDEDIALYEASDLSGKPVLVTNKILKTILEQPKKISLVVMELYFTLLASKQNCTTLSPTFVEGDLFKKNKKHLWQTSDEKCAMNYKQFNPNWKEQLRRNIIFVPFHKDATWKLIVINQSKLIQKKPDGKFHTVRITFLNPTPGPHGDAAKAEDDELFRYGVSRLITFVLTLLAFQALKKIPSSYV